MIDGNDSNDWERGWEKKLKGPGHKANLWGRSQLTFLQRSLLSTMTADNRNEWPEVKKQEKCI